MNLLQTCTPGMFGGDTDSELFARMVRRDEEAKEALAEVYRRYLADLHRRVCKIRRLSRADVSDLLQDTMLQAYAAARTFKPDDTLDTDAARVRTLAWLLRIAHNSYRTQWRRQKDVETDKFAEQDNEGGTPHSAREKRILSGKLHREVREAEDKVAGSIGDYGREDISRRRQLLRDALETLSERERDILIATYEHHERGKVHQRLPQPVIDEICTRYNINSTYLRKLRERAEDKIKKYVEAHLQVESLML